MRPRVSTELSGFCRDCFLLAREAKPGGDGQPDGRAWEREVNGLLWRPGIKRRQYAGTLGLFGRGAASGIDHELDGVGHGPRCGIWIEAKAASSIGKPDVAVFRLKCDDLYLDCVNFDPAGTAAGRWWPVLVSSGPSDEIVRRLCFATGIVLCDPTRLPLPTILKVAANPEADLELSETLLAEAVRLFEPACKSMQERWRLSADQRCVQRSIADLPTSRKTTEALFTQEALSSEILSYLESEYPGRLENRGRALAEMLCGRAAYSSAAR